MKFELNITRGNQSHQLPPVSIERMYSTLGKPAGGIRTTSEGGQAKAYATCSVLMSVINKKVNAIKNLRLSAVDDAGEDIDEPNAINLISHPNSFQSIEEFTANIALMVNVFGKAYIVKVDAVGVNSFELFVVPNLCVTPNIKVVRSATFIPDADIKDYTVSINGLNMTIDTEHMFVVNDVTSDLDTFGGSGVSRMVALEEQINTFLSSYNATHELMVNRGMLAIISLTSGGSDIIRDVMLPQTQKEKTEVQTALGRYGIMSGDMKYAITAMNAAVHPVSSTITDLGLTEVQRNSKKDIADIYQVPSVLLDVEGSTYANAKEAKTILYTDAIIPEARNIFNTLNKIYGFNGFGVMPYYDHLELFQEAKRQQAAGMTSLVMALTNAVNAGLMGAEEAKAELMKYIV